MKEAIKKWVDNEYSDHPSPSAPATGLEKEFLLRMIDRCMADLMKGMQAQAVTDLIEECSYSTQVNGIATSIIDVDRAIKYADRLGEG